MKIILEKEEALSIIHSALCNGGLSLLHCSDVILDVSPEDSKIAKQELLESGTPAQCIEDIWVQILRSGKPLQFEDIADEEKVEFTLEKAMEEMSKESSLDVVTTIRQEQDDACTGTDLLQICLYGEVIFG